MKDESLEANRVRLSAIRREMITSGKLSFNDALAIEAKEITESIREAQTQIRRYRQGGYTIGSYEQAIKDIKPLNYQFKGHVQWIVKAIKAILNGDKL
jgi:hypothetical protein